MSARYHEEVQIDPFLHQERDGRERGNPMVIKPMVRFIGAALIVLGIVTFTYRGIPYTSREQVIDAASLRSTVITRKTISMSLILVGLVFGAGAALLVLGRTKSP